MTTGLLGGIDNGLPASCVSWQLTSPPVAPDRSEPTTAARTRERNAMNDLPEVVVLSAVRTAIGRYGGGLAEVPPCDLAATVRSEEHTSELQSHVNLVCR